MKFLICLLFFAALFCMDAADALRMRELSDMTAKVENLTGSNGVFDTNGKSFILYSREFLKIDKTKTYRMSGTFQLKPYETSGFLSFFLVIYNEKYYPVATYVLGESPINDIQIAGTKNQLYHFPMQFSGIIPSKRFPWPAKGVYMKLVVRIPENAPIDMIMKDVELVPVEKQKQ